MTTTYTIEEAKSGRAGCKKCKEKISKDELRIGTHSEIEDRPTMSAWNHLECFQMPRKFKSEFENNADFLAEHVDDHTEEKVLGDTEGVDNIASKMGTRVPDKKRKQVDANPVLGKIKNNAGLLDAAEDSDGPAKKKLKISDLEKMQATIYTKYATMKVAEMQDVLKWNRTPHSGKKDEILLRIIDGETYGRLSKCPICINGNMRYEEAKVICKGFYNEETSGREVCTLVMEPDKVPRLTWYDHDPSDEEIEAMDAEFDAARPSTDSKVPQTFLEAIRLDIEWDTSTHPAVKKTSTALAEYIVSDNSPLAIPKDANAIKIRKAIGPLMLENMDKSMEEIIQVIVDKYGLTGEKTKAAKLQMEAVASVVTIEANAKVYNILNELSKAYYKESNTNAGNSYKKVCNAVKDLDFEITIDNAKGLGGGKKTKIAGIGKKSAEYMFEFLSTGRLEKLEEKKAAQE